MFFGGDSSSPDTCMKFYADIQMYTRNFEGIDPEAYMANWSCSEIPGPDNRWPGGNIARVCNADYDALVAALAVTAPLDQRAAIVRRMNDIIVQNHYVIPLVWRANVVKRGKLTPFSDRVG